MSRRRYPFFSGDSSIKNAKKPAPCAVAICETPPARYATVQFSWFRGEDGVYAVCPDHLTVVRQDVGRFLKLGLRPGSGD